jgi:hypothetical protein
MTPNNGIIDKAASIVITFNLTEPIICNDPHAYCGVTILLTNANPQQITMSACHVEWTRDDWKQARTCEIIEAF